LIDIDIDIDIVGTTDRVQKVFRETFRHCPKTDSDGTDVTSDRSNVPQTGNTTLATAYTCFDNSKVMFFSIFRVLLHGATVASQLFVFNEVFDLIFKYNSTHHTYMRC